MTTKGFCEDTALPLAERTFRTKQDAHYPPCDFCDAIPDHHPWHGSGMFKGFDRPHIHACNDCRHLLPSPEVAKLVEALEEMIDIAKRVDSWESFPSDPIERAEEAIRAYRKQGGDL